MLNRQVCLDGTDFNPVCLFNHRVVEPGAGEAPQGTNLSSLLKRSPIATGNSALTEAGQLRGLSTLTSSY